MRRGKKYHYLVKDIQVEGGKKKVSVYIGRGELPAEEIKYLMEGKMPKLRERIDHYLKNMEPLYRSPIKKRALKSKRRQKNQRGRGAKNMPKAIFR